MDTMKPIEKKTKFMELMATAMDKEAERLARIHRGQSFTVVKSVATCVATDIQWIDNDPDLRLSEDDQPY
jgi:hypothetical protein